MRKGAEVSGSATRLHVPAAATGTPIGVLVQSMLDRDGFSTWLQLEMLALSPGRCSVRMTVRREMLNGFGVCHGGVTFALADSALAFASNTHGRVTMSVENGISYLAPVVGGDVLTAVAEEEAAGGRLAFYRATVSKQDGTLVAIFRGTVYRTRRDLSPQSPPDVPHE